MKPRISPNNSFAILDNTPCTLGTFTVSSRDGQKSALGAALRRARDADHRRAVVESALGMIGFDWLCYWQITRAGVAVVRSAYVCEYAPPCWPDLYVRRRYLEVDPRIAFASQCERPLVWDLDWLVQACGNGAIDVPRRLRMLLDDAEKAAMRSGIAFSLGGPDCSQLAVLNFSASLRSRQWINDNVVGRAYAVGVALHDYLSERTTDLDGDAQAAKELTPTQRRVLAALTSGLSDREIAAMLDMSEYNVDYHLRRLKKRYGANNRVHLAFLAACAADAPKAVEAGVP